MIEMRSDSIEKAKGVKYVGIILGTLGRQGNTDLLAVRKKLTTNREPKKRKRMKKKEMRKKERKRRDESDSIGKAKEKNMLEFY